MAWSSHTRFLDNTCVSSKVIWGVDLSRKTILLVQSILPSSGLSTAAAVGASLHRAYTQWSSHYSCNDETSYSVYALNSARWQWTENTASHCNKTHTTATYTCMHEPTTLLHIWPVMRHWPTKKFADSLLVVPLIPFVCHHK